MPGWCSHWRPGTWRGTLVPEPAVIALEDGRTFTGEALTGHGCVGGELVFTTAMTGYQEIVTDPSYAGQLVTFTFPMVGNYGVCEGLDESALAHPRAVVARELTGYAFNREASGDWLNWLGERGVLAVSGVDTRALTRHIREQGALRAVISTGGEGAGELVQRARALPSMVGRDLVSGVTTHETWDQAAEGEAKDALHVVAYDFGVKRSILKRLASCGCRLTVVPAQTSASSVLRLSPDGVFLSNGPGDPAAVGYAVKAVRKLLGKVPVFGICLGHQLLALALGLQTYKLRFGHRGCNHPVRDVTGDRVLITTQNHGFAVVAEEDSLPAGVVVSHVSLNDGTVEGIRCDRLNAFSVQFHPEASPGPHDAAGLFQQFGDAMAQHRATAAPVSTPHDGRRARSRPSGSKRAERPSQDGGHAAP